MKLITGLILQLVDQRLGWWKFIERMNSKIFEVMREFNLLALPHSFSRKFLEGLLEDLVGAQGGCNRAMIRKHKNPFKNNNHTSRTSFLV